MNFEAKFSFGLICGLLAAVAVGVSGYQARAADAEVKPAAITQGDTITTRSNTEISKASAALVAYLKSEAAAKRKAAYAKTWTNPSTTLPYQDKSSLKITMIKNPSNLEGSMNVTTHRKTIKKTPDKDQSDWVCATEDVDLTADSDYYMNNDYSDANSHIYPGAIFTFNNFYHGEYKEQEGKRNAMMIYTDNPNITGSSGVKVDDPNIVSIRDGIAAIYRRFTGPAANEVTSYQAVQSYNSADLNMQVSGGGSGYGISFSDAFSTDSSSNTVSLTIDARKALYSISALPPDDGFFADASVESTPDLMVVNNVVYGVRVLANLNITVSSTQEANDLKASYSGVGWSVDGVFNYLSKHSSTASTVNGYVIGGNSGSTNIKFESKAVLDQVNKVLDSATYANARPISYQFMDMAGDIVGSQSATDHFTINQCAPATTNPKVTSVRVAFTSGQDGKDDDTNLNVYLYPAGYIPNPANDDMVGAVYGYQSRSHTMAFGGGQTNDVYMIPGNGVVQGPMLTRNDVNKGGQVRLHIYPNGHDTWDVQSTQFIFNFEDGTTKPVKFPPYVVSQDVRVYDMFIDPGQFAP